jgi:hypothetical protein
VFAQNVHIALHTRSKDAHQIFPPQIKLFLKKTKLFLKTFQILKTLLLEDSFPRNPAYRLTGE